MLAALLRNPLFIAHVIHVNGGITLKFVQAINGTEIKRLTVKVMAGSSVRNSDFHFADWIDWHGRALLLFMIPKQREMFPEKQLPISKWQLAQLKPGRTFSEIPSAARDPYDLPDAKALINPAKS